MKKSDRWRLRILHLLLLILIGISVLPLWFYGTMMISSNQDTLKTKEMELPGFHLRVAGAGNFSFHGKRSAAPDGVL